MTQGTKDKTSPVGRTEWTLYTLAVVAGIAVTLAAIIAHLL